MVLDLIKFPAESTKIEMPRHLVKESNQEILETISKLRGELDMLHNRFDQAIEPMLIDSIIYEMQAVQLRYMYYLDLCKEREIILDNFIFT